MTCYCVLPALLSVGGPAAVRIDGRGKFLIPGLADMHAPSVTTIQADRTDSVRHSQYGRGKGRQLLRGATICVLAGVMPATASSQQRTSIPTSLVFDRVTVVDVEHGGLVPDQRVVITGNRIQAVGDTSAVTIPKDAQVVNASGRYLIPGLWDLHVHPFDLAHLFYPLFIANGVTAIRDAWSMIPLDTLVQWRREILAAKRVGPPVQLLSGGGLTSADDTVAQAKVDSLKAAGANIMKVYPFSFALAAAARRAGLPFGGHVNGVSAIEASDSGVNIMDHVENAGGLDTLCLGETASVERCRPVAERFRRNNTWFVPTSVRSGGDGVIPHIGEKSEFILERYYAFAKEFWAGTAPPGDFTSRLHDAASADLPGRIGAANSSRLLHVARSVGLPILAGTDVGAGIIAERPPGFAIHVELAIYVTEGLTPLEALQTATLNPAKMLRATDSLGTVAPGKLADLVLLDADPLADITNTTTIRAVVANGRYFDRAALDSLLAEVRAEAERNP